MSTSCLKTLECAIIPIFSLRRGSARNTVNFSTHKGKNWSHCISLKQLTSHSFYKFYIWPTGEVMKCSSSHPGITRSPEARELAESEELHWVAKTTFLPLRRGFHSTGVSPGGGKMWTLGISWSGPACWIYCSALSRHCGYTAHCRYMSACTSSVLNFYMQCI